jgi:chemotaxis protein MotB
MARKKKHEEHGNHEAWAIPYGDLVTLLLAFFVVMYAMSSVNEGKYRILSDSLVAAFRSAPKALEPIQVGEQSKAKQPMQLNQTRTLVPLEMDDPAPDAEELEATDRRNVLMGAEYLRGADLRPEDLDEASHLIEQLNEAISKQLSELVDQNLVRIRRERFWLEIEINTSVLFDTASAELSPESLPVLERISETLAGTQTKIQVEGHTDSRPIHTAAFASNWELSAARSANLVRLFVKHGVAPEHLAAVGFGEYRRVADNDTPEGRQKNRRVVIVVMAREVETGREIWARGPPSDGLSATTPAAHVSAPLAQVSAP